MSLALALVLLGACSAPTDDSASPADSGGPVPGEVVPFRVATFNIGWLSPRISDSSDVKPRNEKDHEMIRTLITEHDLSLIALQEIEGQAALDVLGFDGDWSYVVGTTGWSQNPALLYRSDRLTVSDVRELHLPGTEGTSKDPLVATVKHSSGVTFLAVVIHLKPYEDPESAAYRYSQVEELTAWLTDELPQLYPPQLAENVLIMGDFNDTFEGINPDWQALSVLEDTPGWRFATRQADGTSNIYYDALIDHIVLSDALAERWTEADSATGCHVIYHDQLAPWSSYTGGYGGKQNISDHRPVSITLNAGLLAR